MKCPSIKYSLVVLVLFFTGGCQKETHQLVLEENPVLSGILMGDGKYEVGETVDITADANAGYQFASWTTQGQFVSTEAHFTYSMPAHGITLTASFFRPGGGVSDVDGNTYATVMIGQWEWMSENLRVTRFNDGTPIPHLTEGDDWSQLTGPAYCWYDNDEPGNKPVYGALYSWFVTDAQSNGGKNVCPTGWHVPSDAQWSQMISYLDASANPGDLQESKIAGGKLKEAGFQHWNSPNTGATNISGFFGRPGGYRDQGTNFVQMGQLGKWWTATGHQNFQSSAWWRGINDNSTNVTRHHLLKRQAKSIRCIKD